MKYMTTVEAAKLWSATVRQIQSWCSSCKINGVIRVGRMWLIPRAASKPVDGRTKAARHRDNKNK
jgi:hypothetical protein